MEKEALRASEMLLEMGVSVPLRPLRWLTKKQKPRTVTLRKPPLGAMIALSRYFLKIGVKSEELKTYGVDEWAAFVAKHGKDMACIVACGITTSFLSYHLFHKIVAWWLLWRVHPSVLGDVMLLMLEQLDTTSFTITISSAQVMNVMRPSVSH